MSAITLAPKKIQTSGDSRVFRETLGGLESAQEKLHELGVPRDLTQKKKPERIGPHCRRDIEIPKGDPITLDNLLTYETAAKASSEKATKCFLRALYDDPGYILILGKKKRGKNADNWKDTDGDWKSPSLHYANCVYDAIGKNNWIKNGNHGLQSHNSERDQCVFMTKKGARCIRGISSSLGGCNCTQHTLMFP
jgi:hypothetical protein